MEHLSIDTGELTDKGAVKSKQHTAATFNIDCEALRDRRQISIGLIDWGLEYRCMQAFARASTNMGSLSLRGAPDGAWNGSAVERDVETGGREQRIGRRRGVHPHTTDG